MGDGDLEYKREDQVTSQSLIEGVLHYERIATIRCVLRSSLFLFCIHKTNVFNVDTGE